MTRRIQALCIALAALPLAVARVPAEPEPAVDHAAFDSLVASERAFAALSRAEGMRPAFLTYLASDGVIFRPGPVNGRSVWEARENPKATLAWEPSFAEVAGSGDVGWTTGPWEYTPAGAKTPAAYGHFVSVWRRVGSGHWRVAVDIGTGHDRPARGVGSGDPVAGPAHRKPRELKRSGFGVGLGVGGGNSGFGVGVHTGAPYPRDVEYALAHQLNTLLATDRTFGFQLATKGADEAYENLAADDVRFHRESRQPALGREPGVAWHAKQREAIDTKHGGRADWTQRGHGIASSADLGYVYGLVARRADGRAAPDTSAYLHIWRKDDREKWRLALDLESPFPPHQPPAKRN